MEQKAYFLPNPIKIKKMGTQVVLKLAELYPPLKKAPTIIIRKGEGNNRFYLGVVDETGILERSAKKEAKK